MLRAKIISARNLNEGSRACFEPVIPNLEPVILNDVSRGRLSARSLGTVSWHGPGSTVSEAGSRKGWPGLADAYCGCAFRACRGGGRRRLGLAWHEGRNDPVAAWRRREAPLHLLRAISGHPKPVRA